MIGWPLKQNRIRRGSMSNTFGPVRKTADGKPRVHQGWDFEAPVGTPCYAVANGAILRTADAGDYGKQVVLQFVHEGTTYYALYAHLSRVDVKSGQLILQGEQIGLTGNTGNAASMVGPDQHLHFEIRTKAIVGRGLTSRISPVVLYGRVPLHAAIVG